MNLIRRIFGGGAKKAPEVEPMRGSEPIQTPEETSSVRDHMEAEMQAERERRDAKADEGNS